MKSAKWSVISIIPPEVDWYWYLRVALFGSRLIFVKINGIVDSDKLGQSMNKTLSIVPVIYWVRKGGYMVFSRFSYARGTVVALIVTGIAILPHYASAASLVAQYQFPGSPTGSLAPTTTNPNATAGNINFTGSSASQFSDVLVGNQLAINTGGSAISAATAVSTNSYFQFTATANAGFALNLSSLTFDVASANGVGIGGVVVRSSIDGFTSDLLSQTLSSALPSFANLNLNLSAGAFQGLNAITLRIYGHKGATGNNPAIVFDNLSLNGLVSTASSSSAPEPGTLVLLALGVAGGVVARRRK